MYLRILELYSGMGGMHCAWNESGLEGEIVAAVDINTIANIVYAHNFPKTCVMTRNIQKLTCHDIKKLNVNTILMSPPCMPLTRKRKHKNDPRTNSFIHIMNLLPELQCIQYILLENQCGFEQSTVHNLFKKRLEECAFQYQECILCPRSVGVPNCRISYYCLARRVCTNWKFDRTNEIMQTLPDDYGEAYPLEQILDKDVPESYLLPDGLLKRAKVRDICYYDSKGSRCFTSEYLNFMDNTASVVTNRTREYVKQCYERANRSQIGSEEFVNILRELNLRFFTPNEVLRIMAFPEYYNFPSNITKNQCYKLLGNTVNVKLISVLLKMLCA